jgi:hypothetical protein
LTKSWVSLNLMAPQMNLFGAKSGIQDFKNY